MEQIKKITTVTVTDSEESVTVMDSEVFLVCGKNSFLAASCKLDELVEFAVHIQIEFMQALLPQLMRGTKLGVTEDMLFDEIVKIAKDRIKDEFEVS